MWLLFLSASAHQQPQPRYSPGDFVCFLPMVKGKHSVAIGLSFHNVAAEVVSEARPQQRRNANHVLCGRRPIAVRVVQHFVVKRQQIFHLALSDTIPKGKRKTVKIKRFVLPISLHDLLGSNQVSKRSAYEQLPVLFFQSLKEVANRLPCCVGKFDPRNICVRIPATCFFESKLRNRK